MKKLIGTIYKYGYYFALGYWYVRRPVTQGVKCIIVNDDKILLVQHVYGGSLFTTIGGGIKTNETLLQAVIREAKEEVGLVLENVIKVGEVFNESEFKQDTVHVFLASTSNNKLILEDTEIRDADWFTIDNLPKITSPIFKIFLALAKPYLHTMTNEHELVYIDEYGLRGTNFYWHKYEAKGLTKEDILNAGLTSDRVQVHQSIIASLQKVNAAVKEKGYEIFIKEGYRSKVLYEIIYQRRVEKFGKEETDRLLNMTDMPHAEGLSVDIALWNQVEDREVYMRNGEDGIDALFIDFYKQKSDEASKRYQELQEWLIGLMQQNGFRLGTKREYFHFDYRPEVPINYP